MKPRIAIFASIITGGLLMLAAPAASVAAPPGAAGGTRLAAVAFTSPQQGYGLFSVAAGTARTCVVDVARTSDGGSQFSRLVVADSWPCKASAPVSSIAADTSGDVFAFGPALRISHDQGKSWSTAAVKGHVLAVSVQGGSIWAVTASCAGTGTAPDKCQLLLHMSTTGGRSWHLATTQPSGAAISGRGASPAGTATLTRTSGNDAFLLATPVPGANSKPVLWTTMNGGASWSLHPVPCDLTAAAALAIAPSGKIFAACLGQISGAFEHKWFLTSQTGGRTWQQEWKCTSGTCSEVGAGYLTQMAAVSDKTVYFTADRAPLFVSYSGMALFHQLQPQISNWTGGLKQIEFFGANGIILGDDPNDHQMPSIYHSANSGTDWQVTHPVVG